ncbi:hybrid sensor histidine kinase/response regulator [Devosia rhizoryzae]|uniref:histidine kinase n=1 Tax=Devosia rhizoryzae TaxID=2774137 RepID=A0ABX7C481_9HYPH|nr:hybrid sensor histidine kinase/response regulator [Devosia rhizoryzae]QQR38049.1 response regulator [Devosia rhizoryzae]
MTRSPHALILAPRGRDASVATSLLAGAGIDCLAVPDLGTLVSRLGDDISMVVVTEEELATTDLRPFSTWLKSQPAWSDLPIVVLTHAGMGPERNPLAARLLEVLGNVTFLERPFRPTTFASITGAANAARRRQYDARSRMNELAESQERLKTALLAGNLGTWELDLERMQLDASPTCKATFGRSPDDPFEYHDLISSIHPDDTGRMQAAVQRTVEQGEDYRIEYRTIWPDGTHHWAEIHGRRLLDTSGRPHRIVGVSSDITNRKALEQQLLAVNESLERRVTERTAALQEAHQLAIKEVEQREKAEAQLLQAQKVESIGQLTGGVAHDFNNLLMAVLGNLEVLRRHVGDDARATRLIEGALEGAKRGATLTQRLLAFARRQDLAVSRHDLGQLIQGLSPLMQQSAAANVEIMIEPVPSSIFVDVDSNQFELAILNLVVNARDAMPDGGAITIDIARVELEAGEADLPAGGYARLRVTDTGNGMDAETLRRAVEPFFSTKGLGKGTGLGLSMIHGLVLQLGGAFTLESKVGTGTTATILLPIAEADHPAMNLDEPVVPQMPAAAAAARILVVDDDALIAMSTAGMIEDLGHTVIEAMSGKAALDIIGSDQSIDLMITDFSMPRMSGAELIQKVRLIKPELPIILASGYAEFPEDIDLSGVGRLAKPFNQQQLTDGINAALRSSV